MPKHVATRTLRKLEWNNSHVLKGDIAAEVSKLKQQTGKDIVIHGSPGLIRSLMPHHLIDEYRLLVYPIILGHGKRLFDETSQANLKLVESKTYDTGVVKLVYHRKQANDKDCSQAEVRKLGIPLGQEWATL
jgi:dihydrofolate reductase